MSGFSADWLGLREASDVAARNGAVLEAARDAFAGAREPLRICDLGSGTGAAVRAFAPLFAQAQHWRLVDADADNLARASARLGEDENLTGVRIETCVVDLAKGVGDADRPWLSDTDLVTATALFDLVSPDWLDGFASSLARARLPLLATLTYDGVLDLAPAHDFDRAMIAAFNRHQQTDKGFGSAAGPLAADCLVARLSAHGYRITSGESPWLLEGPADRQMIDEILRGWAGAVTELDLFPAADVADWLEARLAETVRLGVGHRDLFAELDPGRAVQETPEHSLMVED